MVWVEAEVIAANLNGCGVTLLFNPVTWRLLLRYSLVPAAEALQSWELYSYHCVACLLPESYVKVNGQGNSNYRRRGQKVELCRFWGEDAIGF